MLNDEESVRGWASGILIGGLGGSFLPTGFLTHPFQVLVGSSFSQFDCALRGALIESRP